MVKNKGKDLLIAIKCLFMLILAIALCFGVPGGIMPHAESSTDTPTAESETQDPGGEADSGEGTGGENDNGSGAPLSDEGDEPLLEDITEPDKDADTEGDNLETDGAGGSDSDDQGAGVEGSDPEIDGTDASDEPGEDLNPGNNEPEAEEPNEQPEDETEGEPEDEEMDETETADPDITEPATETPPFTEGVYEEPANPEDADVDFNEGDIDQESNDPETEEPVNEPESEPEAEDEPEDEEPKSEPEEEPEEKPLMRMQAREIQNLKVLPGSGYGTIKIFLPGMVSSKKSLLQAEALPSVVRYEYIVQKSPFNLDRVRVGTYFGGTPYIWGDDIPVEVGDYVGIAGVDADGNIVSFTQILVTPDMLRTLDVQAGPGDTPGTVKLILPDLPEGAVGYEYIVINDEFTGGIGDYFGGTPITSGESADAAPGSYIVVAAVDDEGNIVEYVAILVTPEIINLEAPEIPGINIDVDIDTGQATINLPPLPAGVAWYEYKITAKPLQPPPEIGSIFGGTMCAGGTLTVAVQPGMYINIAAVDAGGRVVMFSAYQVPGSLPVEPERIVVSPASERVETGDTAVFTATLYCIDGSEVDVTDRADWSVSDSELAVIDKGVVTTVGEGTVTITASYSGLSGTATLKIRDHKSGSGGSNGGSSGGGSDNNPEPPGPPGKSQAEQEPIDTVPKIVPPVEEEPPPKITPLSQTIVTNPENPESNEVKGSESETSETSPIGTGVQPGGNSGGKGGKSETLKTSPTGAGAQQDGNSGGDNDDQLNRDSTLIDNTPAVNVKPNTEKQTEKLGNIIAGKIDNTVKAIAERYNVPEETVETVAVATAVTATGGSTCYIMFLVPYRRLNIVIRTDGKVLAKQRVLPKRTIIVNLTDYLGYIRKKEEELKVTIEPGLLKKLNKNQSTVVLRYGTIDITSYKFSVPAKKAEAVISPETFKAVWDIKRAS